MAAQIHRDHAMTGVGEGLGGAAPRVAGLTATMSEHDRRPRTLPVVGGDDDAGRGGDVDDVRHRASFAPPPHGPKF